jgi:hypothetical protein
MQAVQEYEDEQVERSARLTGGQVKVLAIGTGIGALAGLAAAFLLSRRAIKSGGEVKVTSGDGIRIGLLVLGLLRSIAMIGGEDE